MLNSEQSVKVCDATGAQWINEPLAQKEKAQSENLIEL